jgi:hypothetical protein
MGTALWVVSKLVNGTLVGLLERYELNDYKNARTVNSLAEDPITGNLYVAGAFAFTPSPSNGRLIVNNLAMYDGSFWYQMKTSSSGDFQSQIA